MLENNRNPQEKDPNPRTIEEEVLNTRETVGNVIHANFTLLQKKQPLAQSEPMGEILEADFEGAALPTPEDESVLQALCEELGLLDQATGTEDDVRTGTDSDFGGKPTRPPRVFRVIKNPKTDQE